MFDHHLTFVATLVGAAMVLGLPVMNAHSAPAVNLIQNGGFETPVVSVGGYQLFAIGQHFRGWTVVGAAGNVAPISGAFKQNGVIFPAEAGAQWIDLTGVSNTATGVAQTVATHAGSAYTLTFYVGNVYNPHGIFGTTSTVNVLVNGVRVFTATNARGAGQLTVVWQRFTTTIRAQSAHTTIAFINGDPPSDNNNSLDAVSLVPRRA